MKASKVKSKASKKVNQGSRVPVDQEVDTNVYEIQLSCLKEQGELAFGDPIFCKNCNAVFNKHSQITEEAKGEQIWTCEFCNSTNEVQIEAEETPKSTAVNYIVEAAAQVNDKEGVSSQQ